MPPKVSARQAKIDSYMAEWRGWQEWQNLSERTVEERVAFLRRYLEASREDPLKITPAGILTYFDQLNKARRTPMKPGTKWAYAQHLRAYSVWLIKTGKRDDDPLQKLPPIRKPGGVPKPVGERDLARLVRAAEDPTRMMVLLGAFAGLRVHEIAKVRGEHLNRETGRLFVLGKGNKEAWVRLNAIVLEEAQHYPEQGWWFPALDNDGNPTGQQVRPEDVSEAIRAALKKAGVTATAHQLRHRFGTALLKQTSNLRLVQEAMRHASLSSTQIYTKVADDIQDAAVDGLTLATIED